MEFVSFDPELSTVGYNCRDRFFCRVYQYLSNALAVYFFDHG